ncbi:putative extracellular serine carboxypeptidase [Erysiphe necator]|uniref:Putative serine protein n=1 Tax=Uncinula necator TaxID=52586 RepID=A0A0B1PG72_UNCNE|nr:putative extracellular serine carboxypeptidase [Erysiphe necator]KHJ35871.1 putative serine protein [Erysiphe necator]
MKLSITLYCNALLLGINAASKFQKLGQLITPPFSIKELPGYSDVSAAVEGSKNGTAFFQQILDHNDPSKGTFQMQYWWNAEFWAGPGSPIVFFTPGESAADEYTGYLTDHALTGLFAKEIQGAVVMVEHRYWGNSSPFADLTTKNLQYLTLNQSISDFIYFAKTVQLPFDTNQSSNSGNAPWVFSGGSYSGALAAWTLSTAPGTFWAYHASSAPVQLISDYWQYFAPVQEGMPKNCSVDIARVIDYLDGIMMNGTDSEKFAIKQKFGLESVEHDDDFMGALENGPWLWQANSFTTGYSKFYQFCDAIENVQAGASLTPDENGVGLEKALQGYANWTKSVLLPGFCQAYGYSDNLETACLDMYNSSNLFYTDRRVNNPMDRQWTWMLCNEPFSYWQNGAPSTRPSLVSRLVDAPYWERQCPLYFPPESNYTYGSGLTEDDLNALTKGWDLTDTKRLIWTNGQYDPWKTAGMSSEFRPGGPFQGTPEQPIQVIPKGIHCSDLRYSNAIANAGVKAVIDKQVKQIGIWVAEYYAQDEI